VGSALSADGMRPVTQEVL